MSTKAETLNSLKRLPDRDFKILDLHFFTVEEWRQNAKKCLADIAIALPNVTSFIVRSSAKSEDAITQSNAGKFESFLNVTGQELSQYIEKTIASFGVCALDCDQILIQPMLKDIVMSGVMFTQDPTTGADYSIINYSLSDDSTIVTSGRTNDIFTHIIANSNDGEENEYFASLIKLSRLLQGELSLNALDIEFAFDKNDVLYLLQARPLVNGHDKRDEQQSENLQNIAERLNILFKPHPYIHGRKSIFGVMPDWNPAEIIGIKPKELAISLYKELITNNIWAYQRDNYGYQKLRGFPLLHDFMGIPFIDVRGSFNSLVPKNLPSNIREKLVEYYLEKLRKNPHLHDKVEFSITFSCYVFDTDRRIEILKEHDFSNSEIDTIKKSLHQLTNAIIDNDKGLWVKDIDKIEILKSRHEAIYNGDYDILTKIYWLLEDCKRYGTLPFAGLARAGFIAMQFLDSMVSCGILSSPQKNNFLTSLNTISGELLHDLHHMARDDFLHKYGHLRPGTYDITSPRYDEAADIYFDWEKIKEAPPPQKEEFSFTLLQMKAIEKMLKEQQLDLDVVGLLHFIKSAIEGREYSKFIFTKSLSDVLSLLKLYGMQNNITCEDMAFANIQDIIKLYTSSYNIHNEIVNSIRHGKEKYSQTLKLILPPLITDEKDIYSFNMPISQANFVTQKTVMAAPNCDLSDIDNIPGSILFIPSADPGHDWIFTRNIKAFVTMYGGVNSHMAIRAGELGIPAIIGAGEAHYNQWKDAHKLFIDCANKRVEVLH